MAIAAGRDRAHSGAMAHRPVVLLVDDDPAMRELLSAIFTMEGTFRIGGVACDGLEGAMLCAEIHPDVVVLDYFMPRWDGSKAAEFMRVHSPESKIVAFSAVLGERPEWADDFLLKNDVSRLVPLVEGMVSAA